MVEQFRKYDPIFQKDLSLHSAYLSYLSYFPPKHIEKILRPYVKTLIIHKQDEHSLCIVLAEFEKFNCVAFMGTDDNCKDILKKELMFWKTPYMGVNCHSGFAGLMNEIYPQIETFLSKLPQDKPFIYTGHSLGGAMATMLALHKHPSEIYTFGSPRVSGGHKFLQHFNSVSFFRYITLGDMIPLLPMSFFGYDHVAPPIVLNIKGNPFKTHRISTYLDNFLIK